MENNQIDIVKDAILDLFPKGDEKIEIGSLKQLKVPTYFWLSEDGDGVKTNKLPQTNVLKWEEFVVILKQANNNGGKIYRGDVLARSGARLGDRLNEKHIDGLVPLCCLGQNYGETVLSRSTYFSGVLEKAGIATIHRSDGQGSFITINGKYRDIK